LKLADRRIDLLINFSQTKIKNGIHRLAL
jgi:hypothetical protein